MSATASTAQQERDIRSAIEAVDAYLTPPSSMWSRFHSYRAFQDKRGWHKNGIPPHMRGVPRDGKVRKFLSETNESLQVSSNRLVENDAKFERVAFLDRVLADIVKLNNASLRANRVTERDAAAVIRLIMATGIRPGGPLDRGKVPAYGATTLLGKHVVGRGTRMRLIFTGKKGVLHDIPVKDAAVAKDLSQRAAKAGPEGRLFQVDSRTVRRRFVEMARKVGGDAKVKDLRTMIATAMAKVFVEQGLPPAKIKKQVALALGNTPSVAGQHYIDPAVMSAAAEKAEKAKIMAREMEILRAEKAKAKAKIRTNKEARKLAKQAKRDLRDFEDERSSKARSRELTKIRRGVMQRKRSWINGPIEESASRTNRVRRVFEAIPDPELFHHIVKSDAHLRVWFDRLVVALAAVKPEYMPVARAWKRYYHAANMGTLIPFLEATRPFLADKIRLHMDRPCKTKVRGGISYVRPSTVALPLRVFDAAVLALSRQGLVVRPGLTIRHATIFKRTDVRAEYHPAIREVRLDFTTHPDDCHEILHDVWRNTMRPSQRAAVTDLCQARPDMRAFLTSEEAFCAVVSHSLIRRPIVGWRDFVEAARSVAR
mgnify:CR=1 FL=1